MPRYMLLLYDDPKGWLNHTPEQIQQIVQEYSAWAQGLAEQGKMIGGHKLTDEGGQMITNRGGAISITDGPYAETKEVIGGFFIINAGSYDEAVQIARSCPHNQREYGVRIDIRQEDPHTAGEE